MPCLVLLHFKLHFTQKEQYFDMNTKEELYVSHASLFLALNITNNSKVSMFVQYFDLKSNVLDKTCLALLKSN